ncbi:hypothetical protein GF312_12200 [Candidatus Poribacteria bacterium]|nr:hypothetical protein [Candidatus Poribacteria bacterium]
MKNLTAFIFIILGLIVVPNMLYGAVDTTGLVLYMPFDEGSGNDVTDVSGNGNDGELEGGAEWVDGYYGKGLRLSEIPDFVSVEDSPSLDIEEAITLGIWANIEGLPDGSCALFMKATAYMLHTTGGGDGVKMDPLIFIGGNYGTWPTPVVVSAPMGEWHHYAATFDGAKYDLFIDGELIDSYDRVSAGPIDLDDNPLTIGRDSRDCCSERNSPCTIDEAMVWSRALSEEEMAQVINGNFMAVEPGGKLTTSWANIKSE